MKASAAQHEPNNTVIEIIAALSESKQISHPTIPHPNETLPPND
jgi:hypothetical protein